MEFEQKDFKFSLTTVDPEAGTFTGYASVFGEKDSWGDVVQPGAFKKTIKEHKGWFPLLWYHDVTQPLGSLQVAEDEKGLRVEEGQLNLDVAKAREVYSLMKQQPVPPVQGLSIGYETVKEKVTDDERQLKEISLWETSLLVFQACPGATVDAVKAAQGRTELLGMLDVLLRKEDLNRREQQFVTVALHKLAQLVPEDELIKLLPVGTVGTDGNVIKPPVEEGKGKGKPPEEGTRMSDADKAALADIKTMLKGMAFN